MSKEVARMPIRAHDVKVGKYVILQGKPCKVVEVKLSKTGKHGHMKSNITGIDVLTGKKFIDMRPSHETMTEFKLEKNEYQLIDIESDSTSISCLDHNNKTLTVVADPDDQIFKTLKKEFDAGKNLLVTVIRAPVEKSNGSYEDMEKIEAHKQDMSIVKE